MTRVRDKRPTGFFIVYNDDFDGCVRELGPSGFLVYAAIVRHADYETKETNPFYSTLTRKYGVSRATIARTIRRCIELGLLTVAKKPGRGSVYTLRKRGFKEDVNAVQYPPAEPTVTRITAEPQRFSGETGSGSVGRRGQCSGETGGLFAPLPDEQHTNNNNRRAVVAGDVLGSQNASGAALLTARGVQEDRAIDLANKLDLGLLDLIIEYWEAGAGGIKPVGVGLLVRICERPQKFGFRMEFDEWVAPRFTPKKKAQAELAFDQKIYHEIVAEKTKAAREKAAEEDAKAAHKLKFSDLEKQQAKKPAAK